MNGNSTMIGSQKMECLYSATKWKKMKKCDMSVKESDLSVTECTFSSNNRIIFIGMRNMCMFSC